MIRRHQRHDEMKESGTALNTGVHNDSRSGGGLSTGGWRRCSLFSYCTERLDLILSNLCLGRQSCDAEWFQQQQQQQQQHGAGKHYPALWSYLAPCTVSEIQRVIGWKLQIFPTALSFNAFALGEPFRSNFWMKLIAQKLEGWGYTVWWKLHNPNFSRFGLIHPSDRRTDGRKELR